MGKNIVFFIGAGFTKAIANTAPTGAQFLSKAFNPNKNFINDIRIQKVKEFIDEIYYPITVSNNLDIQDIIPTIEDILSLIDYSIQNKETLYNKYLYEDIIEIRNNLIYLIGKVIKDTIEQDSEIKLYQSDELIEKIKKLIDSKNNTSIISTNYDIILDNSLIRICKSCNYGFRLRNNIHWDPNPDQSTKKVHGQISYNYFDKNKNYSGSLNKGQIDLLKIHGSLNWFYCPKCKEIDITIFRKGTIDLAANQSKYVCVSKSCTSNYEPLIVTPTMLKIYDNDFIQYLWKQSEQKIADSDQLVFIGYSLPEADYHLRSLITRGLVQNQNKPNLLIIDKKPENSEEERWSKTVEKRYKLLFGNDHIDFKPIDLSGLLKDWNDLIVK
jgi:NAD-dependent SIR2 family protein deacetylase